MTKEKRELCKAIASRIGRNLPNGPLALAFKNAGLGLDEEPLKAIDMALSYYEQGTGAPAGYGSIPWLV